MGSNYIRAIAREADEQTLIDAAKVGDRAALDALLRQHYDRIYAVCRRLAGNEADALDATQEALINISRRIDRFDGRAAFSTWAYRVATNACLDELRRRGRRPTPGLPEHEPAPRGGEPGIDSRVAGRLDIESALAELPEDFRAPVVLRDQLGMDYAEIADVLAIPPGTVRSRIARGRGRLADLLGGNQDHADERPTPDAP